MFIAAQARMFRRPEKITAGLRGFLELERDALRTLPEAIDPASVGRWKSPLTGGERQRLEAFRERYCAAITAIDRAIEASYD